MYMCVFGEKRTEIENKKMKMHNLAPFESNRKTMKSASGKRPPDEAHGPGEETIRPQQSSVAWRSSNTKVHKAGCADSASKGCTE